MNFSVCHFQVPKDGATLEECEDAFSYDERKRLYAISDGATDSAFQKRWAKLLVEGFTSEPPDLSSASTLDSSLEGWLKALQFKWNESIDWEILPFHGYNKARLTGGLATFLGIYFASDKEWRGFSVGDCNLFHFREGKLYDSWTIRASNEFGNNPIALSSISQNYEGLLEYVHWTTGDYAARDIFLLTTDALAELLLKSYEKNPDFNKSLSSYLDEMMNPNFDKSRFEKFIKKVRRKKHIRNDDVTLLVIQINESRENDISLS